MCPTVSRRKKLFQVWHYLAMVLKMVKDSSARAAAMTIECDKRGRLGVRL